MNDGDLAREGEFSEPVNLEMEMAALGSMMFAEQAKLDLAAYLQPSDFFRPAHQELFRTLITIEGEVDLVRLRSALGKRRKLTECGGEDYLIQIAEFVPSAASAKHYAESVKDYARRRSLLVEGRKLESLAWDFSKDLPSELGRTRATLDGLSMNGFGPKKLETTTFGDEYEPPEIRHLLFPYLQVGKAILWDADGGTHKTGCIMAWAAAMSNGVNPLTREEIAPVKTLYLHKGEDLNDELELIYRSNGGRQKMLAYVCDPSLVFDPKGIERLGNTIVDGRFQMVAVDAFFYFLPDFVKSTNDNLPVLKIMVPYNAMLAETEATSIDVRHTSKMGKDIGKEASELGMGSQQFRNSHRGQLLARYDPHDKSDNKRVIVTDEKGSLLNPRGKPFAFRRNGLEFEFVLGEIDNPFVTAKEEKYASNRAAPVRNKCQEWLSEYLQNAAVLSGTVLARAEDAGFKHFTVYAARKALGLEDRRQPKAEKSKGAPTTWWALPGFDWTRLEAQWAVEAQPELAEQIPPPDDAHDPYAEP